MIDVELLKLCMDGRWCLDGIPYSGETKSSPYGTLRWYKDGKYHREDGPAYEGGGHKEWWIHGKLHRKDGPAVERADGTKAWFIHGNRIKTWKEYHELSTLSPQEQMVVKLRYGEDLK